MILGRGRILTLVESGLIEDFSIDCLGGAGYDLRLGRIYSLKSDGLLTASARQTPKVEEVEADQHTLRPGDYVLLETLEKINMPLNLAARILNRSTVFRCGCTLINAFVDPGYRGTLTFGLKNLSTRDFTVERGARIAQIVFEEVAGETEGYCGRYQGGKVV